jgi:hypothetical protein
MSDSQGVRGSNPFSSTERERRNLSNRRGFVACEVAYSESELARHQGYHCRRLTGLLSQPDMDRLNR